MYKPTGTVCGIDALSSGAAGLHVLVLEFGLGHHDLQFSRLGQESHGTGGSLQSVRFGSGHGHTLHSITIS